MVGLKLAMGADNGGRILYRESVSKEIYKSRQLLETGIGRSNS
jgi:hypothetical protein